MENLKHIFNINQTIHDTKVALDQGKLLAAHKKYWGFFSTLLLLVCQHFCIFSVMDLELARDELLFEVHKSDSANKDYEKNVEAFYLSSVRFACLKTQCVTSSCSSHSSLK